MTEAEAWAATEDGDVSSFLSLGLLYLARWRQVRGDAHRPCRMTSHSFARSKPG
jgi:hypothetical protein